MHYRFIFLFHLILIPFLTKAQYLDKMSFGINFSYAQFNMHVQSFHENYIFDGDGLESDWSNEELADFNQGKFLNHYMATSLNYFSGLSGTSQSKFRIGFEVFGGFQQANQTMKNDTKTFYKAKNKSLNIHYGSELQLHYTLTDKWSLFLSPNLLIQEGDLNHVIILNKETIYADPLYFDQIHDNSYELYAVTTHIAGIYSFQKLKLALGPELVWLAYEATYHESIYDRDNDHYTIYNEVLTATNQSIIQVKAQTTYSITPKLNVYISFSLGNNFITKTGVYYNL